VAFFAQRLEVRATPAEHCRGAAGGTPAMGEMEIGSGGRSGIETAGTLDYFNSTVQ
jgi:hypothetical protein